MTATTPVRFGLDTEIANPNLKYPTKFGQREVKLAQALLKNKNVEDTFEQALIMGAALNTGAVNPAEAAAGTIGFHSGRAPYECRLAVVESTGTAAYAFPYVSADGLEIPLDANVTDGPTAVELGHGITARSRAAFVVGTDGPFFFECTVKIDDISDLEEMFVGFRKAEAYQADPDSYADMAAFHIGETGATVADGQVNIATILNDAATTYTDTTLTDWANDGEHTLRVEVDRSGRCTFKFDDEVPTVTKAFTFDSGDTLIPFLYVDNTTGSTTGDPGISVSSWRCGLL